MNRILTLGTAMVAICCAEVLSSCAAHRDLAPPQSPVPVVSSIPKDMPFAGENGYTRPDCLYCPAPQYSSEAFQRKVQGQVVLDVVIGADGQAREIVVKKSLEHSLDEQAIRAVHDVWRFKPANGPDGKPATVHLLIEIDFHLYNR